MDRLTHPRSSGIKTGYWSPEKKEALIERLAAYEDTGLTLEEIVKLKDFCENPLNTAVPVLEQGQDQRWIPVEERLPDTDDMVLVTCRTKKGVLSVNRAYCSNGFWHGSGSMSGVIAWMPLPEPYREES